MRSHTVKLMQRRAGERAHAQHQHTGSCRKLPSLAGHAVRGECSWVS